MDLNAFAPQGNLSAEEAKRERIRHGAAFYDTARKTQDAFNALEACRNTCFGRDSRRLRWRRARYGDGMRYALLAPKTPSLQFLRSTSV